METCPRLLPAVIISDDPRLAALVSCGLALEGAYLPVMDGPRLQRPDGPAEIVRRNNGLARAAPKSVVLAGVTPDGRAAIERTLPKQLLSRVDGVVNLERQINESLGGGDAIRWGRDRIGVGLLKALRAGTTIVFEDRPSPDEAVPSRSGHMVLCEAGEDLSEVIAANYAFALGAGLKVIPAVAAERARAIMDQLYGLYEGGDPHGSFQGVRAELRDLCGDIDLPEGGSLTFVTRLLPFGIAFPEAPSTHLFSYPDLGLAIINGLAAEQPGTPGVNVAVLIDPHTTEAGEIEAATTELVKRRTFVRVHSGAGAEVTDVSDTVELYPYDLLVFATHCGDADGYRWTYEFTDSEDIARTLVVDIALGIGKTDETDILAVLEFMRFHELDGIDWNGPEKESLYVGQAIVDFMELKKKREFKPTKRETIDRVLGSAVMRMHDNNYLPMHRSLADKETPILINNACVSWHELAGRYMFAGARAYVGTLVEVNSMVAQEVVPLLVGAHYGKPLAEAVWAAQRDVFGNVERQPYVTTGVYPQFLRSRRQDTPAIIREKLEVAQGEWREMTAEHEAAGDAQAAKRTQRIADYYERELAVFGSRMRPAAK